MASVRHWYGFPLAALVATFVACSSNSTPPAARPRSVSVGTLAPSIDAGARASVPGVAAAPQSCPADASVFCDAGCCSAGQTCGDDGGCSEAASTPSCPADFPVACATAESCSGGACIALDSSGNGRNFTLQSPAGFVAGKFGTGVSTNLQVGCSGPWMTMDAGGLPSGNAPMTLELWLRSDGGVTGSQSLIYGQGDESAGRWLMQFQGGQIVWPTGSQYAGVVDDSAWHFIAVTWDDSNDQGAIYLDGALKSNRLLGSAIATPADAGLVLGGNCNPFSGDIDELRILSFAADAGQIAADFKAGQLSSIAGTVGLWHFDEGSADRCCPSGTTCGAAGCAGSAVPPSNSVDCGDGGFCAAPLVCTPAGCAVPGGGTLACPPDAPVDCGDGTCCASDLFCSGGTCRHDDAGVPSNNTCPAYAPTAFALSGSEMACCNTLGYPMSAFDAVNVSCTSGETLNGAVCEFGGSAVGCGNGGCNAGSDYCCADPSGQFSTCMESAPTTITCPGGGVPCSGDTTHPGGCCASGMVCAALGVCCPGGEDSCGGGCCPSGQCSNGSCVAPPAPKECSPACPEGTVCNDGYCIAAQPAPTVCGNGTPCGSECCPNGLSCVDGTCAAVTVSITCPDNLPSQCGPAGPCCREGFTCFGNSGPGPSGFYCIGPLAGAHQGPDGPECEDGDFCAATQECRGSGLCCPPDITYSCGDDCCTFGQSCTLGPAGGCGCLNGADTCGGFCCDDGSDCVDDICVPSCDGGTLCGDFCCDDPYVCKDGACSCPDDHPVQCGGACCLSGGACDGTVDCSCPADQPACGFDCCPSGEECVDGACAAPNSSGGGSGGGGGNGNYDGTYAATCTVTGQLGGGTASATLVFSNGVLTSGLSGGSGSVSSSGLMTLMFTDGCGVSFAVSGQASSSGASFTLSGGNADDPSCAVQSDTCTVHKE